MDSSGGASGDAFLDEWQIQNDYLRQQLVAIARRPAAKRREFRLFVLWCKRCSDVLLEVVDTRPFPVVRLRHAVSSQRPPQAPAGASVTQALEHYRSAREASPELYKHSIRLDKRWRFIAIPPTMAPNERSSVSVACRCQEQQLVELRWVYEQMNAGIREATR